MPVLDTIKSFVGIGGGAGPPAVKPTVGAQYMKGGTSPFFFNWRPALRDSRDDAREAYMIAAARAIDAIQNSGWLTGAVNQAIGATVGDGLRLASKPDAKAIGMTQSQADDWSKDVEAKHKLWANSPIECDARATMTVADMEGAVLKSYFSHGETVGLLPLVNRPGATTRTKVKLLPAHKLMQDSNGFRQYQGITTDGWGMPVSYRFSLRMREMYEEIVDVRARDRLGRQQVIHVFDGEIEQMRGVTPLAPALRVCRQYDQLSDATLTASLIQAIFAATIESEAPTDAVLQALQDEDEQGVGGGNMDALLAAKGGWYDGTKIDLGRAGKIAHLFPGEKLIFNGSKTPNSTYEAFAKFLMREIARCLGLSFETLTGDYTAATYSSVRMSTSELWPLTVRRRAKIPARFRQLVFEAWLEEQIETGIIPFPGGLHGFIANRAAACNAEWKGPPKPQADDLKTAKAHQTYRSMGVITDEQICNDLGTDVEDVYRQRAHEKTLREKYELPEGDPATAPVDDATVAKLTADDSKGGGEGGDNGNG
jgi:lambda family phage portal protein